MRWQQTENRPQQKNKGVENNGKLAEHVCLWTGFTISGVR